MSKFGFLIKFYQFPELDSKNGPLKKKIWGLEITCSNLAHCAAALHNHCGNALYRYRCNNRNRYRYRFNNRYRTRYRNRYINRFRCNNRYRYRYRYQSLINVPNQCLFEL